MCKRIYFISTVATIEKMATIDMKYTLSITFLQWPTMLAGQLPNDQSWNGFQCELKPT